MDECRTAGRLPHGRLPSAVCHLPSAVCRLPPATWCLVPGAWCLPHGLGLDLGRIPS
ncbi:hypothetical protein [Streptomyces tendae]|uniref:hypothetical protein n=1 Tax=Streptomyces tendae TaxID=1932 RepID=UPI0037A3C4EA